MSVVKYGIVGCGAIAQRRHIPECIANPKSKLAALFDINQQRVTELATKYGATPYTDFKQLLKADLDAVVICGPNALHAAQSIAALKAGKHVLCEKPMATTRADGKKMIATAKAAGKLLMIGLNQRLMAPHIRAREILDTGKLGKVITFSTTFKHPGPDGWSVDGAKSWFFDAAAAFMGVTGDLGVHKADLLRWLLRTEFTHVSANIATLDKRDSSGKLIGLDDNAFLNLRGANGVCGSIEVSWSNYGAEENDTKLYCEKGVLHIGADPTYGVIVQYRSGDREMHKVGEISTNTKQVASGVIDSLTAAILGETKLEIDGSEGYRCLDIILTAMDAAKAGRTLAIGK